MSSLGNSSDLLFWPLVIFAVVVAACLLTVVKVVSLLARREPTHHPQVAGPQGTNTYDASSHNATNITIGEVNVNTRGGSDG